MEEYSRDFEISLKIAVSSENIHVANLVKRSNYGLLELNAWNPFTKKSRTHTHKKQKKKQSVYTHCTTCSTLYLVVSTSRSVTPTIVLRISFRLIFSLISPPIHRFFFFFFVTSKQRQKWLLQCAHRSADDDDVIPVLCRNVSLEIINNSGNARCVTDCISIVLFLKISRGTRN